MVLVPHDDITRHLIRHDCIQLRSPTHHDPPIMKSPTFYISYTIRDGEEILNISDITISPALLGNLMRALNDIKDALEEPKKGECGHTTESPTG